MKALFDIDNRVMLSAFEKTRCLTPRNSRAQAIKDGVLINLSRDFPECHKRYGGYPIACTQRVWDLISLGVNNPDCKEDFKGIVLDLLRMSASVFPWISSKEHLLQLEITGDGEDNQYILRAICGPGDCGVPVVTIMLRDE